MSAFVEGNHKAFVNGGTAIDRYLRVKLDSGVLAVAGIADREIGVTTRRVEADAHGDVLHRNAAATVPMVASEAIAVGADVFTAASGKVGASASTAYRIGTALSAATADGDVIEVLRKAHAEAAVA